MVESKLIAKYICFAAVIDILYHAVRIALSKFCSSEESDDLPRRLNKHFRSKIPTPSGFHKALFFPDPGVVCRRLQAGRVCKDEKCLFFHDETSLSVVIKVMKLTLRTLDVCVYLMTNNMLADALIECHQRDVIVRVITDDRNTGECGEVSGATIGKLRAAGIQVRCYASSFWMHHKFVVADKQIFMSGSLNWTNQGVMGNLEDLVVSSQPELVAPFAERFEELWEKLKPDYPDLCV